MPSAGLPIESFGRVDQSNEEMATMYRYIETCAAHAMRMGMFSEWLESFVGAWNHTKDPHQAATAGLTEWDL